jgi:hypothetical protein
MKPGILCVALLRPSVTPTMVENRDLSTDLGELYAETNLESSVSEIRMHWKSEHRRNEQHANKVIEELRTEIANAIRQQKEPESHV